jgi:4-hydroxyphenylpyruvate dioxygenase
VSSPELEKQGKQRSVALAAGDCIVVCSAPLGEGGRAWRYLRKHPDGVGTVAFEVEDIEKVWRPARQRGGTPITDIQTLRGRGRHAPHLLDHHPVWRCTWRFFERRGYRGCTRA